MWISHAKMGDIRTEEQAKDSNLRRILILGSPGSGKSTLALKLGERLGLEVIHLDRHFWNPGWVQTPIPEWMDKVEELVAGENWIIEGNYSRTLFIRIARADGVIWLDFPRLGCFYRCMKRAVRDFGKSRPDMAPGCLEKVDWGFIRHVWTSRERERPIVESVLEVNEGRIPVLHLKSIRNVNIDAIVGFVKSN